LRPWRRETREVRWSTAAALLSAGAAEAEERAAAISFSARRWLDRTVDRRASRGTRTSWCSSRTDSAARVCRPPAAGGVGGVGGAGDGVSMAISIASLLFSGSRLYRKRGPGGREERDLWMDGGRRVKKWFF